MIGDTSNLISVPFGQGEKMFELRRMGYSFRELASWFGTSEVVVKCVLRQYYQKNKLDLFWMHSGPRGST